MLFILIPFWEGWLTVPVASLFNGIWGLVFCARYWLKLWRKIIIIKDYYDSVCYYYTLVYNYYSDDSSYYSHDIHTL